MWRHGSQHSSQLMKSRWTTVMPKSGRWKLITVSSRTTLNRQLPESQLNVETEMNRVSLNRKQWVNWDHKIESCWAPKKQWKYGSNENLIRQSQSKIFYGSQFLGQDIDKVCKKMKLYESCLADIEREVRLLKIQLQEAKKEYASSQSLKKKINQVRGQIVQV